MVPNLTLGGKAVLEKMYQKIAGPYDGRSDDQS